MTLHSSRRIAAVAVPVAIAITASIAGAGSAAPVRSAADREQETTLISKSMSGGIPNAGSTHGVISNDKRYARLIAYQSEASDIVPGDTNGQMDVFAVKRQSPDNTGSRWRPARTLLVSRGRGGQPANGPSFAPAVDGGFHNRPKCVAFLSGASNLVAGDTNGKVDAFVSRGPGGSLKRMSLPGGKQSPFDTTQVAVSGDCKRIAWVTGARLFVKKGTHTKRLKAAGGANDPSFSTGQRHDLVYGAGKGVYLARGGTGRPRLIARGGHNPAFNDIKRRVVAYEISRGGHVQIEYKDLGKRPHVISKRRGSLGNGDSRDPVIGNAGYYVTFESDATNLGVNALSRVGDYNGQPDAYLYTNVRDITLVQSVEEKAVPVPGGGYNPSMSFYANYVLFDSPAPIGRESGEHQVYMRWLGAL